MEIVLYACLMVVPLLAVAAFILSMLSMGKIKRLQTLVVKLGKSVRGGNNPIDDAIDEYMVTNS